MTEEQGSHSGQIYDVTLEVARALGKAVRVWSEHFFDYVEGVSMEYNKPKEEMKYVNNHGLRSDAEITPYDEGFAGRSSGQSRGQRF